MIVFKFIIDKYFLSGIPSHYLMTDASHVPLESLRFFKVDGNWINALVDGAMSLANHIDRDDDSVRSAMRTAITRYLKSNLSVTDYPPPIPQYGCYLRTSLVTKFPDLIVATIPPPKADDQPVLLRHEIVATDTMLCLFGQPPGGAAFKELTFTQPPHQQTFSASVRDLMPTTFTTSYKRAYTIADPTDPKREDPINQADTDIVWTKGGPNPGTHPAIYVWDQVGLAKPVSVPSQPPPPNQIFDVRRVLVDNLATDYLSELNNNMPAGNFKDSYASSALMAYQFNTPCYFLQIGLDQKGVLKTLTAPSKHDRPIKTMPVRKKPKSSQRQPASKSTGGQPRAQASRFPSPEERAIRKIPLKLASPPPHIPMIRKLPRSLLPKLPPPKGPPRVDDPGDPPTFNYYFWSADQPGVLGAQGTIPMRVDGLAQDIIFSIRLQGEPDLSWELDSISIQIPIGPPSTTAGRGPLLNPPYTGQTSMLSNLRFNPRISYSDDNQSLVIILTPRSSRGYVMLNQCLELSFMMGSVVVNVSDKSVGDIHVVPTIVEQYEVKGTRTPKQPKIEMVLHRDS
jgi:hypothetical protein